MTTGRMRPPMPQTTLSAMELLVISVLGADLVDQLLQRYEAPPDT